IVEEAAWQPFSRGGKPVGNDSAERELSKRRWHLNVLQASVGRLHQGASPLGITALYKLPDCQKFQSSQKIAGGLWDGSAAVRAEFRASGQRRPAFCARRGRRGRGGS